MGEGIGVDPHLGDGERMGAGIGGDHRRTVEEGRGGCGLRELGGELAEGQMLAASFDESERGDVPEHRRAPVAQQHLVAIGHGEHLGDAVAQAADHRLDGVLAMAGAEVVATGGGQRRHRLGAHLGRTAAEAAIGGKEVGGDRGGSRHAPIFAFPGRGSGG